jgi:uncharacterized protein (TIGR03067 family)
MGAERELRVMAMVRRQFAAVFALALIAMGAVVWTPMSRTLAGGLEDVPGRSDKEKIQGAWVAVSAELGGKPVSDEQVKKCKVTFEGDKIHLEGLVKGEGKGSFALDPSKNPRTIDILITDEDDVAAIYALDGDELRLCINTGGSERPKEFATTGQSKFLLIVFKR